MENIIDIILFSTVSVLEVMTTGAFVPMMTAAVSIFAKKISVLKTQFATCKLGNTRMSACPATGLVIFL